MSDETFESYLKALEELFGRPEMYQPQNFNGKPRS